MRTNTFLLLTAILLGSVLGFNIRTNQEIPSYLIENNNQTESCSLSCFSVSDKVLPGNNIGFNTVAKGLSFDTPFLLHGVEACCSQKKHYERLLVPDYVEVTKLNIPDEQTIQVDISPAIKNENQTLDNRIFIVQKFERRALNVSIPVNKMALNLTVIEDIGLDLTDCQKWNLEWMTEFNYLGKSVFTSQILGVYSEITVELFTNQTYTEEQVAETYKKYIQKKPLDSIEKAFPKSVMNSISTLNYGGISLLNAASWKDFLESLNSKNYLYTPKTIFPESASPKY